MTHPNTLQIPRAVVEQALEALLSGVAWREGGRQQASASIDDIRAALQAQPTPPRNAYVNADNGVYGPEYQGQATPPVGQRGAPACENCLYSYEGDCRHSHGPLVPNGSYCGGQVLKAQPTPPVGQAAAEPVAWTNASWLSNPHAGHFSAKKTDCFNVPLYTMPQPTPDAEAIRLALEALREANNLVTLASVDAAIAALEKVK